MSELLDPTERRNLQQLGLQPGWRCLEVGSGNGSIAQWLASQVGADGHVVASDIETSYIKQLAQPNLEVRQFDILLEPVEQQSLRSGGDTRRPASSDRPEDRFGENAGRPEAGRRAPGHGTGYGNRRRWLTRSDSQVLAGWFRWAASAGIDYFVGSKIAPMLDDLGMEQISAVGETALFNGGSPWAIYCVETIRELRPKLAELGHISDEILTEFEVSFRNPHYWTSAITFVALSAASQ